MNEATYTVQYMFFSVFFFFLIADVHHIQSMLAFITAIRKVKINLHAGSTKWYYHDNDQCLILLNTKFKKTLQAA